MSARRPAAALDAATPMPTPRGWRPLGELQRGDEVFCADGLPARISGLWDRSAAESEPLALRLCDGTVAVCGPEQPWLVGAAGGAELIAAGEIARSLRSGQAPRYSVALPAPLEHRFAEYPADPYEQGARLGSGLAEDAAAIPGPLLHGDVLQRRELLMGLLDEGGGVGSDGSVHFDTTHRRLARDVCELVASLGYRVTLSCGGGCRGSYKRVSFRTGEQVFGLRAPAELLRERSAGAGPGRRWIVEVCQAGRRAMRSLEVDAENHLLVAGESLLLVPDAALAGSVELQLRLGQADGALT